MNALVSIIVPVYNLEGYIDNCLKSLVNQTYRNLEILCIDDGSTDASADVIKSFSEKDNRVIYVYKENGGVSSARNLGLDMFKGEYVMFVDGDDFLHPQAVEIFTDCIEKTGCDIACADYILTSDFDIDTCLIQHYDILKLSLEDFLVETKDLTHRAIWSKFYTRRSALCSSFPIGITNGEDTVYLFKVFNRFPSIAYISNGLYYYFNRLGSASKSKFRISAVSMVDGLSDLSEFLYSLNSLYLLSHTLKMLFKAICSNKTLSIGTKYEDEVLKKCKTIGKKWIKIAFKNKHISLKEKVMIITFFYSRHLYELARLIADPTMIDFYKNRRKHNGDCQKD